MNETANRGTQGLLVILALVAQGAACASSSDVGNAGVDTSGATAAGDGSGIMDEGANSNPSNPTPADPTAPSHAGSGDEGTPDVAGLVTGLEGADVTAPQLGAVADAGGPPRAADAVPDVVRATDWPAFVGRSDLVWTNTLPATWDQGPFVGNGSLGTLFFNTANSLWFELGRTDVYDHRKVYTAGPNGEWTDISASKTRLPIGHFALGYVGTVRPADSNARLDLWNAEARGTVTTSAGTLAITALAHATSNVMVFDVTTTGGESAFTWDFVPAMARTTQAATRIPAAYVAYPPATRTTIDGVTVSVQSMPDSATYNTAGTGEGQHATAWRVVEAGAGRKLIYVSIGYSYPGTTAASDAAAQVNAAVTTGVDALVASHRDWWHTYYPRSLISVPAANAEAFYWVQMYKMASATRATSPAIDLQGPWIWVSNGTYGSHWPFYTHNLNTQLAHAPFVIANHADIGDSLINALNRNRVNLAANAAPYSSDSYALGLASGTDFKCPVGTEAGDLTYLLHDVWEEYRYTRDDEFLRTQLFPLLKGAFNYLNHIKTTRTDGRYHLPVTSSPEYGSRYQTAGWTDSNYTLSLFRWLAGAVIEANDRLSLADPVGTAAADVLAKLTPYPTNADGFMIGDTQAFAEGHRHWSNLFMIYPLLEYTYDDPAQAALIDRSVDHWVTLSEPLFRGYSFLAASILKSMKGDGAEALRHLDGFLNLTSGATGAVSQNTMYREGSPVIESPLYMARALQEMVLMSYGGILRVLPGVSPAWADVTFDGLRADGGFLVSARRQAGATRFIRIESLAGEPLRVKTGLSGTVQAYGNRAFSVSTSAPGVVDVDLRQGEWVVLYSGDALPDLTLGPVAR